MFDSNWALTIPSPKCWNFYGCLSMKKSVPANPKVQYHQAVNGCWLLTNVSVYKSLKSGGESIKRWKIAHWARAIWDTKISRKYSPLSTHKVFHLVPLFLVKHSRPIGFQWHQAPPHPLRHIDLGTHLAQAPNLWGRKSHSGTPKLHFQS